MFLFFFFFLSRAKKGNGLGGSTLQSLMKNTKMEFKKRPLDKALTLNKDLCV